MSIPNFINHNKQMLGKLSFALALFLVASIGFATLADTVHEGETLKYDEVILRAIHSHASPTLDAIVVATTDLGGIAFVTIMTVVLVVYLLHAGHKYKAVLILFGVGGAALVNLILKLIFERVRPDLWTHLVTEASFSFPSGHAMASSALAFAVVAILWRTKWRTPAIISAAVYIILVGFTRLYLGVHYPTDVLAGWFISLVWVMVVAGFVYLRMRRTGKSHHAPKDQ